MSGECPRTIRIIIWVWKVIQYVNLFNLNLQALRNVDCAFMNDLLTGMEHNYLHYLPEFIK